MTEKCPYCGKGVVVVDSSVIYGAGHHYGLMKTCQDFPKCDSYSGHGASLANKELRELRKKCHRLFDAKWKAGEITRGESYKWLQRVMKMRHEDAHISKFGIEECKKLLSLLQIEK